MALVVVMVPSGVTAMTRVPATVTLSNAAVCPVTPAMVTGVVDVPPGANV